MRIMIIVLACLMLSIQNIGAQDTTASWGSYVTNALQTARTYLGSGATYFTEWAQEHPYLAALAAAAGIGGIAWLYTQRYKGTPLHLAILAGDKEQVEALVRKGANPTQSLDSNQETPLMLASRLYERNKTDVRYQEILSYLEAQAPSFVSSSSSGAPQYTAVPVELAPFTPTLHSSDPYDID